MHIPVFLIDVRLHGQAIDRIWHNVLVIVLIISYVKLFVIRFFTSFPSIRSEKKFTSSIMMTLMQTSLGERSVCLMTVFSLVSERKFGIDRRWQSKLLSFHLSRAELNSKLSYHGKCRENKSIYALLQHFPKKMFLLKLRLQNMSTSRL